MTLFLVDTSRDGFKRGRNLDKLGMKAQDTSELFFDNLRVSAKDMLGGEGQGFTLMMTKLSQERLAQAIRSATVIETVIEWTADYTAERKAFGQSIADFQNTQFVLADLKARATMARVFTDKCIELFMAGKLEVCRRRHGEDDDFGTSLRSSRQVSAAFRRLGLHVGISDLAAPMPTRASSRSPAARSR